MIRRKIFLISLLLILLFSGTISFLFVRCSFSDSVSLASEFAAETNACTAQSVKSEAEYSRVKNNQAIIDYDSMQEAVNNYCSDAISSENGGIAGVYITARLEDYFVSGGVRPEIIEASVFPEQAKAGRCYTCIFEKGGEKYMGAYSTASDAGWDMKIYTACNVSDIYAKYERNFILAVIICVLSSLFISLTMLILIYIFLRPLKTVDSALESLADGQYDTRVPENGSEEVRTLAKKVNLTAQSAEKNIKKLESVAQGRKQYVDRLAHEMKTPLTSILCFADLLRIKKTVSDEERSEYAGIIVDEAKRMKNMSSKLLELAVAESAEIELVPTFVLDILTESVTAMSPGFEASGIKLEIRKDAENGRILCDKELFKSLIYNICDNARKASESGQSVTLTCRRKNGDLLIFIVDRGIGMTKDVLKKVTRPFYMADKDRSRKEGGAGIGLSLCVEIAKLHGATVSAKSRPGKGTTMIISVPEAKEDEA